MVINKKANKSSGRTAKRKTAVKKPVQSPALSEKTEESCEKEVQLKPPIIVKNLADVLNKKPSEIIKALMTLNVLASINQTVEVKIAEKLCESFGFSLVVDKREKDTHRKIPDWLLVLFIQRISTFDLFSNAALVKTLTSYPHLVNPTSQLND